MNESPKQSLDEVLGNEMYVYQGKVYPRKHLYKTSLLKTMFIGLYLVLMLVVIGGVAAWSMGMQIAIPNFILGIEDEAPTVQVRERPAVTAVDPAEVATTTDSSGGEVSTSAEVLSGEVQTSAEVVVATSTATTTP